MVGRSEACLAAPVAGCEVAAQWLRWKRERERRV
jgi:hypothetical protein